MNPYRFLLLSFLPFFGLNFTVFSQSQPSQVLFREMVLKLDTAAYRTSQHLVTFNGEDHLAFGYDSETEVCEVKLYPTFSIQNHSVSLIRSADFEMVDSLVKVNNAYYRFKV